MKKAKKLLTSIIFAFALLLIAPVIVPGYSNTEVVRASDNWFTLVKGQGLYSGRFKVNGQLTQNVISCSSSNNSVATVTIDSTNKTRAKIVAKGKGSATIKIKYSLNNSRSYTHTYNINVATINRTSIVRCVKGSYPFTLSGVPTAHKVSWSIENPSVATVSSSGIVTAKAKGTTYLYATINDKKQRVAQIIVEALAISKGSVGLTKGNTYTLKVVDKANGVTTPRTVTWSSSNTSVATVTSKGTVTAVSAGTAKIYASIGGVKYVCNVTVKNPMTAADYMNKLKETVQKSSKVSSSGEHYLYRGVKSGTSTYKYYVLYNKNKDRLRFYFTRKDSDSKRTAAISMYIYNPSKSYNTTPSLTITTKTGIKYKTKRSFDYRTYDNEKDATFTITYSNKALTETRKTSFQANSNTYLQYAMKGWNTLLKKNGFTMEQIGFTKF